MRVKFIDYSYLEEEKLYYIFKEFVTYRQKIYSDNYWFRIGWHEFYSEEYCGLSTWIVNRQLRGHSYVF